MAGKTKKIHNNEQVIRMSIDIKCNKATNIGRLYKKLVDAINADWECIVIEEKGPNYAIKTEQYLAKQNSTDTPV